MELNPLNDKTVTFELSVRNSSTGVLTPVTGGSVSAIIATTDAPDATAADPSLSFNAVHIGGANGFENGTWMVFIDAAVLTVALLASLPRYLYLIAIRTGDIRAVTRLENVAARYAEVST